MGLWMWGPAGVHLRLMGAFSLGQQLIVVGSTKMMNIQDYVVNESSGMQLVNSKEIKPSDRYAMA